MREIISFRPRDKLTKDEIHERNFDRMIDCMEVNITEVVKLDDIVGLHEVKQILQNTIYIRNRFPTLSKSVKPLKGVLLFGVSRHY